MAGLGLHAVKMWLPGKKARISGAAQLTFPGRMHDRAVGFPFAAQTTVATIISKSPFYLNALIQ